jgi:hypothetical protein
VFDIFQKSGLDLTIPQAQINFDNNDGKGWKPKYR